MFYPSSGFGNVKFDLKTKTKKGVVRASLVLQIALLCGVIIIVCLSLSGIQH